MRLPQKEQLFSPDKVPELTNEQIKKTAAKGFQTYMALQKEETLSPFEFFTIQFRIMNKKVWLMQAILIGVFSFYLHYLSPDPVETCKVGFVAVIPLFIFASFPELWRNVQCGAIEIENTTYFNMKKIYMARLLICGITDLIGITILILIASLKTSLSLTVLSLYILVPFISTCCISFTVLCLARSRFASWYASGLSTLWVLLLYQLVEHEEIYEKLQSSAWILILSAALLYLAFTVRNLIRQMESYFEKTQGEPICY